MNPPMTTLPTLTQPAAYRIRFAGRANNGWSDFLSDLTETRWKTDGASMTELTGCVTDQSALFGLLCRLRDLGVPLISVEFIENIKGEIHE